MREMLPLIKGGRIVRIDLGDFWLQFTDDDTYSQEFQRFFFGGGVVWFFIDNIFWGRAILPKVLVFEFQNKSQRNTWRSFYFLCIEFIELMWYNKSLKVSSLQFYYTLWVYIIVFSLPQIKSFSINIYFSLFYPFPSLIIIHFSLSMRIFLSIFSLFLKSFQTHLCWHLYLVSMILFVSCLFYVLRYTYKWIQVVFFFLCLISIRQ